MYSDKALLTAAKHQNNIAEFIAVLPLLFQ